MQTEGCPEYGGCLHLEPGYPVPDLLSLVSGNKNKRYRIGDIVKVKVIAANKEIPAIDFEVI